MITNIQKFEKLNSENYLDDLKILGTNLSYWQYEYDSIKITAYLLLEEGDNTLYLKIIKTHTKSGLGSGTIKSVLENIKVGTIFKPDFLLIRSTLKKRAIERSSSGSGFSKLWEDEEGNKLSLRDLIELNTPKNEIKNINKAEKNKKLKHIAQYDEISDKKSDKYNIEVIKYSDKSYALFGDDTRKIKDELINIGCRYNRFLTDPNTGEKRAGWICSIKNIDKINKIIK